MTNNTSTDILNDILETLIDSAHGYEKAAEIADRETFKNFFSRRAEKALDDEDLTASAQTLLRNYQGELRADGRLIDHLEDATS